MSTLPLPAKSWEMTSATYNFTDEALMTGLSEPATASTVVVDTDKITVKVCEDFSSLVHLIPAWKELARNSIEPNPFYEPWMLMPALESFAPGKDIRIILFFAPDKSRPSAPPVLCGLFPVEKLRAERMPVKILSLWKHNFCFLCTPLIRSDCARKVLEAFFGWLDADGAGCPIMQFKRITADGQFNGLLVEIMHERLMPGFEAESYARALFIPHTDGEQYLSRSVSGVHRKDMRRKTKRLSEIGLVEFDELRPDSAIDVWIDEFLELEEKGWKGKTGGALASSDENRKFFASLASEAFLNDRLMMIALRLDGKPIAQKCNLLTGDGSFAFKIAYDESYSRYSPGVLLEAENIHRLHLRRDIKWMDSCAKPSHPMINRLWPDRRLIRTVLAPTRRGRGELLIAILPLARWLNRKVRRLAGGRRSKMEPTNT